MIHKNVKVSPVINVLSLFCVVKKRAHAIAMCDFLGPS